MQSIELIQAEAKAADLCLTILTDAGLIGENLVTKLRDAQQAILACLPKMYAACNAVEKETGKNMYRVTEAVVQMFSRAKWADHDAMMTRVEALLVAFVEAAKAEEVPAPAAEVAPVEVEVSEAPAITAEQLELAKTSIMNMEARAEELKRDLSTLSACYMAELIPVSNLGTHTFDRVDGVWKPTTAFANVRGWISEELLAGWMPQGAQVMTRGAAIQQALDSNQQATETLKAAIKGVEV